MYGKLLADVAPYGKLVTGVAPCSIRFEPVVFTLLSTARPSTQHALEHTPNLVHCMQ